MMTAPQRANRPIQKLFDRAMSAAPGTVGAMTEIVTQTVSSEQYCKLVDLAVERITDAERCAAGGCFSAACAMAGAGVEAAIMAHVCCFADDVRATGRWHDSKAAPLDWSFEKLIQVAVAQQWLPASRASIPEDEAVDKLAGEVGDAVRFVQYARNLVVHPGKYVLETLWLPKLDEREYRVVYGVTRAVIDHLYANLAADGGTSERTGSES